MEKLMPTKSPVSDPKPSSKPRRILFISIVAGGIVLLALALGLGLGLGLHRSGSLPAPSSSPGNTTSPIPLSPGPVSLPPVSAAQIVDIRGQPAQTREYALVIQEMEGAPDGVSRSMLVVNGTYPGPTIVANQADRLLITVYNQMTNVSTAIHWHGLFQNGTNYYDGTNGITQCGIPPNTSLTYNFTLGEWSGTTWWHAHYGTQYTDGVSGAFIVLPSSNNTIGQNSTAIPISTPPTVPIQYDADVVVHLSDWYHAFSTGLLATYLSTGGVDGNPGDNYEPVPDSGTINGAGQWGGHGEYWNFTLEQNMTYRFRLINAGSLGSIRFSIDEHPLSLISIDGVDIEPVDVAGVIIAVAQRADVLVRTNRTEQVAWWVRGTLQTDMFAYTPVGQNLDIRAMLRYAPGLSNTSIPDNGNTTSADPGPGINGLPDVDPISAMSLSPAQVIAAPDPTRQYPVTVDFQSVPTGDDANESFLAFMNNTSWAPLTGATTLSLLLAASANNASAATTFMPEGPFVYGNSQLVLTEDSIQTVDIIINNQDDGSHPFHLHGHRPWILATGAGGYEGGATYNTTNPMRRDVHVIPAYSWAILRFVTDNPGFWAFHCHVAWHMGAGLLMQVSSLPSRAAQFALPSEMVAQCSMDTGSSA